MQIHDAHPPTEPLDFLKAWGAAHSTVKVHRLDSPSPAAAAAALLSSVPRNPAVPDEAIQALLTAGVCISLTEGSPLRSKDADENPRSRKPPASSAQLCIALRGDHVFKFERPGAQLQPFDFATSSSSYVSRGGGGGSSTAGLLKRVRHGLDVDGPNTANLGCKKRRLRIELITSRLSRAYSQPATHILNREGQKSGDKRFLKMATSSVAPMARRLSNLRATSYVRYSTMNRMRQRLGTMWPLVAPIALPEPGQSLTGPGTQKDPKQSGTSVVELKCKTQWRPPSLLTASRGQFVLPEGKTVGVQPPSSASNPPPPRSSSPLSSRGLSSLVARAPSALQPRSPSALAPRPPSASWPRAPPLGSSSHRAPAAPSPPPRSNAVQANRPPRPASPAPHPLVTGAAASSSQAAVAHPASSPERPPPDRYAELEEDSFAGRHLFDDEFGDAGDDGDQVYSDFSVIFNADNNREEKKRRRKERRDKRKKAKKEGDEGEGEGEGEGSESNSDSDDEDGSYEEFLDELDGISWVAL